MQPQLFIRGINPVFDAFTDVQHCHRKNRSRLIDAPAAIPLKSNSILGKMSYDSLKAKETRELYRQRLMKWTQEAEARRIQKQEERGNRAESREVIRSSRLRSPRNAEEEEEPTPMFLFETVSQTVKRRKRDVLRLPQISDEMENVIKQALDHYLDDSEILCNAFNIPITRRDIKTLADRHWLNDQVINFYLSLIMERSKSSVGPKVFAFNTLFYPKLMSSGYNGLERWTRTVDLFQHDIILIPVHSGAHWSLATVCPKQRMIQYYDSQGRSNLGCLDSLRIYMEKESKAKDRLVPEKWKLKCVANIPQQMNYSDCGMFTLKYAEYLSRGENIDFKQRDMPLFRRMMVYEIITKMLIPL